MKTLFYGGHAHGQVIDVGEPRPKQYFHQTPRHLRVETYYLHKLGFGARSNRRKVFVVPVYVWCGSPRPTAPMVREIFKMSGLI